MKEQPWVRFWLVCVALSVVAGLVGLRVVNIQHIPESAEILADSVAYQGVTKMVYPERGNIYDSKGRLLAGNETVYEVGLDLAAIQQPETIASAAANLLGMDYLQVLNYAKTEPGEGGVYYINLGNFVENDKVKPLIDLNNQYETMEVPSGTVRPSLSGLTWVPYNKRSYPEKDLASNILGFYSFLDRTDGIGYFGVEETYDQLLAGTPVEVYSAFDPQKITTVEEVPPGASLILTIDREIQAMTEQKLDEALEWSGAESGTILVYNPEDGGIIAMATTPRLDPNEYWNYSDLFPNPTPFNQAVSETYEPGSVFKVLTMAAALDAGAVTPETVFTDTGQIMVGGAYIYNWNSGAWGDVNMTECLQHSLNVCLAWIATQVGPDKFYSYLRAFGLDRNTGIDLGSENHWPLKVPGDNQWYEADLATNSFGQGISVTPIQMAVAIGSIANEGKMMAPHVVKAMIIDGKQYDIDPVVVATPIKTETAETLTEMLKNSLEQESSNALVEGYSVAGKTGTAEIPTQLGYTSSVTNTSFVGWGPTDDPKFLVYIWLEKPTISIWGSEVAAPVFADLVKNLVVLMDIPPDEVRMNAGQSDGTTAWSE